MKDYFKLDCPYTNKCKSKGISCGSCKHNKDKKEDHYEPIYPKPYRIPWTEPNTTPFPWKHPPWTIICRWIQRKFEKEFKSKIAKISKDGYDYRGVWITVNCRCGHTLQTPFFIRENGQCPKCNRRFYRRNK